jgi:hypothetical protein
MLLINCLSHLTPLYQSNYNHGKKLVDFLNFQTLSPFPLIQCWYLGDMCCKSTLPEPTLFVGGGGGGFKVNSCFN